MVRRAVRKRRQAAAAVLLAPFLLGWARRVLYRQRLARLTRLGAQLRGALIGHRVRRMLRIRAPWADQLEPHEWVLLLDRVATTGAVANTHVLVLTDAPRLVVLDPALAALPPSTAEPACAPRAGRGTSITGLHLRSRVSARFSLSASGGGGGGNFRSSRLLSRAASLFLPKDQILTTDLRAVHLLSPTTFQLQTSASVYTFETLCAPPPGSSAATKPISCRRAHLWAQALAPLVPSLSEVAVLSAPTAATSSAAPRALLHAGWLTKKAMSGPAALRNWKQRWFELDATTLRYMSAQGQDEKGCVSLTHDMTVRNIPPASADKRPHAFELTVSAEGGRGDSSSGGSHAAAFDQLIMAASTDADRDAWREAISRAVADLANRRAADLAGRAAASAAAFAGAMAAAACPPPPLPPKPVAKQPRASTRQFGVPLEALPSTRVDGYAYPIPTVLVALEAALSARGGRNTVGIFRLAPDANDCKVVKAEINAGQFPAVNPPRASVVGMAGDDVDVNVLANLIKVFFRELPVRLFDGLTEKDVEYGMGLESSQLPAFLERVVTEPALSVTHWLLDLCVDVVLNQEVNKMNATNISIVISPNLYSVKSGRDMHASLALSQKVSALTTRMIEGWIELKLATSAAAVSKGGES